MREDVLAARKEADRWIGAEDFVRWISDHRSAQYMPRIGFAAFLRDDYFAFFKKKPGSAAERAFERWKKDWARPNRFIVSWESLPEEVEEKVESALARQSKRDTKQYYLVPLREVAERVRRALARRDELDAAFRSMRPPRKRRHARDLTPAEVSRSLGVPTSTIYQWVRDQGLPHDRVGKKKKRIRLSLPEVEEWAKAREAAGKRVALSEDWRVRVPAEQARPRLREIRDYLGLSNERFAELLGISKQQVVRHLADRWQRRSQSIPHSVMMRAEALLDTTLSRSTRTTKTQRITKQQLEKALKENGGRILATARALGIDRQALHKVAGDLGVRLTTLDRVPVEQARPFLLRVRKQLRLNDAYYSELLGTTHSNLKVWLGLGGRWRDLQSIPAQAVERAGELLETMTPRVCRTAKLQKITKAQVAQAWESSGGNVKGAAAALGVSPDTFNKLAESRGVELPVPLIARITKSELKELLKRHRGVRASMARELGVSAPYVTMLLKKAGLYEEAPSSGARARDLDKARVEQILRQAIRDKKLPNNAAKDAGLSRGSVLKKAADRFGLGALYEKAKAQGKRPPRKDKGVKRKRNPQPKFRVRSPKQGLKTIKHADITKNFEKALRFKPKHRRAVLVPCAQTKPFPDAPSHRDGYLKALKGKKVDVFVVSEPLGVVPYAWSREYPNAHYDFPPHHLRGQAHDLLARRVAQWLDVVGRKYDQITLALPAHHMDLVEEALDRVGDDPTVLVYAGITDCLDRGACPPGHYRPTSQAYRKFLRARANPPVQGNPFGMTGAQIAGKLVGWTAAGAVAELVTDRIDSYITQPLSEAAERAITKSVVKTNPLVRANPYHQNCWAHNPCPVCVGALAAGAWAATRRR